MKKNYKFLKTKIKAININILINMKTNKLVQKEAEFKLGDVETINWNDLDYLLKKASKLKRKRYRFCLHSNHKHPTQK